ncbi:uncharacterized protein LOC129790737 [Lutzomyia longipalpis]|uniref:uncharacterized protein LOC129790737 n=1 Tax=Lutzomyia longipalpis TaxID=7200 RepID=UPI0024841425|nr:uncharacterized protein LOC129790737 [Lutzomyia longipalpis]
MTWERPVSIPFPQNWCSFSAKDPESGGIAKYKVTDLSEDKFEEAVDLMVKYFLPDEVMCQSLDLLNDEDSLKEMKDMWWEILPQKVSLVCYKEGSNEICGLNMLEMSEKSDSPPLYLQQLKGKSLKGIATVAEFLKEKANIYERYNVDRQLYGLGLLTLPKYRGCGIATELLKARFPLMKALGVKLTGTVFSGPGSQGAARKAGFTDDFVATYEELGKNEPFVEFLNTSWPVVKFMCYYLK